ncbi:MAG: GlsB/YeaQ/YmgE family stress response membrane protein [Brachymonas sp.]|nr:GlsB/YeaQ/YmgE family stress response membrane protein [Brachymonas sp.]
MNILYTILIGFAVGLVARALKPGRDTMGWIMTTVLGVAGSMLAGFAGHSMGWYKLGQVPGFVASVVGSMVLLVIYKLLTRS